jgi:hypothetical protein
MCEPPDDNQYPRRTQGDADYVIDAAGLRRRLSPQIENLALEGTYGGSGATLKIMEDAGPTGLSAIE